MVTKLWEGGKNDQTNTIFLGYAQERGQKQPDYNISSINPTITLTMSVARS